LIEILEAAHTRTYKDYATNRVTNGPLLRADVHTLFDLNLIGFISSAVTYLDGISFGECTTDQEGQMTLRRSTQAF